MSAGHHGLVESRGGYGMVGYAMGGYSAKVDRRYNAAVGCSAHRRGAARFVFEALSFLPKSEGDEVMR